VEEAGGNLFANPVVDHGWMYDWSPPGRHVASWLKAIANRNDF